MTDSRERWLAEVAAWVRAGLAASVGASVTGPAWQQLAPRAALEHAFGSCMWIGHVIRALDWERMLATAPDDVRATYQPRIARWLRRWYEHRELAGG